MPTAEHLSPDPSRKPRAPSGRRRPEFHWVAEIISWRWNYSLSINNIPHLLDGAYLEHRHIELSAWTVRPAAQEGETFNITIIPDFDLEAPRASGKPPLGVAVLQRSRRRSEVTLRIPPDALSPLLTAFSVGHLKYVALSGDPPEKGSSIITRWSLDRDYSPNDLPPEGSDRQSHSLVGKKRRPRSG